MNRRDLLTASALVLAGPAPPLPAVRAAEAKAGPTVLRRNENPYRPLAAARLAVFALDCRGPPSPPDAEMNDFIRVPACHEGVSLERIVIGSGSGVPILPYRLTRAELRQTNPPASVRVLPASPRA